jgi:NADP-dependent 3-hydroxy acid dehydrogenase YdfG
MLQQNYQDTKTAEEIEQLYAKSPTLTAEEVAEMIIFAINRKLDHITILPHNSGQK